ncbi:MAG: hypothetical protein J0I49_11055 [Pseudonocardia sp.]|uniref:hypothetical protein n=1 Tax=Pseudonocardia sp. TaxID=60912 RepID=UPI001ACE4EFD|nr:hypothetical protein [Pseudonocardia sp.]MBN9098631.1 hypothetical protein [Pseudonocardia sp.]
MTPPEAAPPGTILRPRATVAVSTLATGLGAYLGFVPGFLAPVLQADLDLSRTALASSSGCSTARRASGHRSRAG